MRLPALGLLTAAVCLAAASVHAGAPQAVSPQPALSPPGTLEGVAAEPVSPEAATPQGPSVQPHGRSGVRGDWVPQDTTPNPTYKQQRFPTPHGSYVTTQGSHHHHYPLARRRGPCACQVPASLCSKPKIWTFSQFWYQMHHEFWHGMTDPCWLMDPDCCGESCHHQKSRGALALNPYARQWSQAKTHAAHCGGCRGGCHQWPHDGCHRSRVPTPQPQVAENAPQRSALKPRPQPQPQTAQRGVLTKLFQRR